ncbi:PleD family two-component system response regulator [Tistrella mobilis]|uniref:diguanylate cyclase n=1 Tax=Tistrella mobilis (strain KA081020-065) TaxID=1110502 RepID=I3TNQ9_TISMK|nr:PleD family two-component system response regulator [Tistrella mobilis]AFK54397.1 response regulator With diguanylate cyclase (GGDEF) domain protein [Tistrella mobilis KA081020-065]
MPGRVLVVDDLLPNLKLFEAKLAAEYYDVDLAQNGEMALARAHAHPPDIVLLDIMMPGMDGYEVCRRLKSDPETAHIPVVMVTALSDSVERVRALEAGADDFLTKPINDLALFARVRSLTRLKMMLDELRLREQTISDFGGGAAAPLPLDESGDNARVLVVDDSEIERDFLADRLKRTHSVSAVGTATEALDLARTAGFDLIVINLLIESFDPLRLCSQLRAIDETRQTPILVIVGHDDVERMAKALDLGVNDYLMMPLDVNELGARVRTQVRRKRYQDRLRQNYQRSIALAATDGLTGLYNRRYLSAHLHRMFMRAGNDGRPLAVLMLDIDRFKQLNDTYGHDAGDRVLQAIADRMSRHVRGVDLVARYGGEEFVMVLPDSDHRSAHEVAERVRAVISGQPIVIDDEGTKVTVTASLGGAQRIPADQDADDMLRRADQALYRAKAAGRDCFIFDRPT